ncbi:MAG: S41 family peptidase [Emcibacteraceae bacterium]
MTGKIVSSMITAILSILASTNSYAYDWSTDLNVYRENLEKNHIDLYHHLSKEEFDQRLETLKKNASNFTNFQVTVELMRLTHDIGGGMGDGHTAIPLWNSELHRFPIEVINFNGDIRIVGADEKYAGLIGRKILSINDTPVERIIAEVSAITPFTENKFSGLTRTSSYMMIAEILNAMGITETITHANFTLQKDDNTISTIEIKTDLEKNINQSTYQKIGPNLPPKSEQDTAGLDSLWFSVLPDKNAVYIKFAKYPSFEQMNSFTQNLLEKISKTKTRNLIVDMRDNYGGDLFIGLILASYLNTIDMIDWKKGVFVLTNRKTFSAAAVNTAQYRQLLNATIVGEPTGGNPNGPQDMGSFTLPSSGLLVTYSKRFFRLQDKNSAGITPDIEIITTWPDYIAGNDKTLETVYKIIADH